jgi:predicted PurR-regulated permease PerM
MHKEAWDISWGALWKIFLMIVIGVVLFYVKSVLLMVFMALIISSALHGPVGWLQEKKIPRIFSTLAIFLFAGGLVAFLLYIIVPVALIQLKYFLSTFSAIRVPLLSIIGLPDILSRIDQGIGGIMDAVIYGGPNVIKLISDFVGNVFFMAVSLVIAFYLTLSRDGVERFIQAVFPPSQESYFVSLYHRTRRKLGHWLGGQLILSVIVAVLVFVGLSLLRVDYALILALLALVLELVPYVGPIVVGTIAFLIVLPKSLMLAILVVVVFTLIQQIESHALVPLVMGKTIGINPVMIVIAMLAGSDLAGIAGIIVAVPTIIIFQELLDDWGARKRG